MSKRKTTTITERFDDSGNIYERVTQTVEEEIPTFEPGPAVPAYPPPDTTPAALDNVFEE